MANKNELEELSLCSINLSGQSLPDMEVETIGYNSDELVGTYNMNYQTDDVDL